MVIFHCYVSSPEGSQSTGEPDNVDTFSGMALGLSCLHLGIAWDIFQNYTTQLLKDMQYTIYIY